MNEQPLQSLSLNTRTVKDLLDHLQTLKQTENIEASKLEAFASLQIALEKVLPFVPEQPSSQPSEIELEQEIREEIVIAGANENG